MSTFKKIVIGLIIFVIAVPMIAFGYFYFKLNSMYDKDTAKDIKSKIQKVEDKNEII